MSGLVILVIVFTLGWLPIKNVCTGKLNTTDIETANSILQRLHRLQEQRVLNDRIKKQRLEEVNNHNERVKFLHKLSQGAQDLPLSLPEEEKSVNDLFKKLQQEESAESNKNNDDDIKVLVKALALLQGAKGVNKPGGLLFQQKVSNKQVPFSMGHQSGKKKRVTLPMPSEIEINKPVLLNIDDSKPLSLLGEQDPNKGFTYPLWDSKEDNDVVSELLKWNQEGVDKAVPLSLWQKNKDKKPLQETSNEKPFIPFLSWNDDEMNGKENNINERENGNIFENLVSLLEQQQRDNKYRTPEIKWRTKNRGHSNGFLTDLNLKSLLNSVRTKSSSKTKDLAKNNYFVSSANDETEENENEIGDDKLDGYSNVFVVLDPDVLSANKDNYQAKKILSKLSTWAGNLKKYWEPKTVTRQKRTSSYNFRRRRPEYSDENLDRGKERRERPGYDESRSRYNKRSYRAQRGGGGRISRTAAPFVHPRGDIYEKILE